MSGVRSSKNPDYQLQELVREESNREKIDPIQPDIVEYDPSDARGSLTDNRQPGPQQNILLTNHQSGVRLQNSNIRSQNRVSAQNINIESGSVRNIQGSRIQSQGLLASSPEWRQSKVSTMKSMKGPTYGSSGTNQGQTIVRDRSEKIIGDHTLNKQSKIEYVPFERKVTDYEIRERRETVPKKRMVTEYTQQVIEQLVPRVVTKNDYYAVQYVKEYIMEKIPEKTVRMVQRRVPYKRVEYVPVTREVIHYHGGGTDHQGIQMCEPSMGASSMIQPNQFMPPSFYQNYDGNFFNSQPSYHQVQPLQVHQQTADYTRGIEQLSKYSSNVCNRFKLRNNHNLYDHYETYIPSFKY